MHDENHLHLTPAEWKLMDYLWEVGSCTGREASDHCIENIGWSRTTTLTLMRNLIDKGAVFRDESCKKNRYAPLIDRDDTCLQETQHFLRRVYRGSVSMMLSAMTKKQQLSAEEIAELRQILDSAEDDK